MDEGDCPCAVQPSSNVAKQNNACFSQSTLFPNHFTSYSSSRVVFFGGVAAMLNLSRCAILIFIPQ